MNHKSKTGQTVIISVRWRWSREEKGCKGNPSLYLSALLLVRVGGNPVNTFLLPETQSNFSHTFISDFKGSNILNFISWRYHHSFMLINFFCGNLQSNLSFIHVHTSNTTISYFPKIFVAGLDAVRSPKYPVCVLLIIILTPRIRDSYSWANSYTLSKG